MQSFEFDVVRSKNFNFHSITKIMITKLKIKCSEKVDICEYKLDTDSDGNLMFIRMYKMLLLHTEINQLNQFIKKSLVTYNIE